MRSRGRIKTLITLVKKLNIVFLKKELNQEYNNLGPSSSTLLTLVKTGWEQEHGYFISYITMGFYQLKIWPKQLQNYTVQKYLKSTHKNL